MPDRIRPVAPQHCKTQQASTGDCILQPQELRIGEAETCEVPELPSFEGFWRQQGTWHEVRYTPFC